MEVSLLFSTTPTSSVAGIRQMIEIVRFLVQDALWCLITAPYHGAGKQLSLLIRAKTIVGVRPLYMTALKPFGVRKPNSLKTGPALVEVLRLFTTTLLAFSVAGIRHMPEIEPLIMQGAFWCSVIAPYRGAGKRFLFLIQLKTRTEERSLYTTALKPFGEGKHDPIVTGPACMRVPWLFTTTPTFSVAGIR